MDWQIVGMVIVGCYAVLTLFSLVTLPVEFDASNRALAWVEKQGVVTSKEQSIAKDALKWAAMTYVVAALASLVTLLYLASMFFGGRD
jgi:Zn-dependent membrane protease YugP